MEHWVTSYDRRCGEEHTKDLDKSLPRAHTKTLCDHLPRPKVPILAQLRTGRCKLKAYLNGIGPEESDLCDECKQTETVKHFLLD